MGDVSYLCYMPSILGLRLISSIMRSSILSRFAPQNCGGTAMNLAKESVGQEGQETMRFLAADRQDADQQL